MATECSALSCGQAIRSDPRLDVSTFEASAVAAADIQVLEENNGMRSPPGAS